MNRRDFLKFGALALSAPSLAFASEVDVTQDMLQTSSDVANPYGLAYAPNQSPRHLWIKRDKDEFYLDVYTAEGYRQLSWLARDIRAGDLVGVPSPHLVRLSVWMQAWMHEYGYKKPLILTSGLRTYKTNSTTEGAARASLHLPDRNWRFRAFDLEAPNVPSSILARIALAAKEGGVGFYGDYGHVHIDDGQPRFWTGRYKHQHRKA